jgi:hypothetical protein
MKNTSVPVTVAPEAEEYIRQLGLQGPFEQMIEHAIQVIPGLRRIEVELPPRYDLGGEPVVLIEVIKDLPKSEDDPTNWELARWQVETFPPEVLIYFTFLTGYE